MRVDSISGFERVNLRNDYLTVSFLPGLGGKMTSIKHIESGREFLLQPFERAYRRPTYADKFEDYDTSGFDECFPTVSPCEYPDGSCRGMFVPDHGELWSTPWEYNVCGESLSLAASGRKFPYIFRKHVRLRGASVILSYELESTSKEPFKFIWSAHPLLAVSPGCQIILPKEVKNMLVQWSHDDRLGMCGDTCSWPFTRDRKGNRVSLAEVTSIEAKTADKLFTERLSEGYCAVYYPQSDESIEFRFDAAAVPYIGLWICQGGWPSPDRGHFTMALEPCSGRSDSLAEAAKREECQVLPPGETTSWELAIQVQEGCPTR